MRFKMRPENPHIFGEIPAHVDHRKSEKWNQRHAAELAKLRKASQPEKKEPKEAERTKGTE